MRRQRFNVPIDGRDGILFHTLLTLINHSFPKRSSNLVFLPGRPPHLFHPQSGPTPIMTTSAEDTSFAYALRIFPHVNSGGACEFLPSPFQHCPSFDSTRFRVFLEFSASHLAPALVYLAIFKSVRNLLSQEIKFPPARSFNFHLALFVGHLPECSHPYLVFPSGKSLLPPPCSL